MEFRSEDYALPHEHQDVLIPYREYVRAIAESRDTENPEGALAFSPSALHTAEEIHTALGAVRHVVLVGIGGSSLGTEAIHAASATHATGRLEVIDALSAERVDAVVSTLTGVPLEDIAIVIISKSGSTTETIANASLLIVRLTEHYGDRLHERVVVVTDPGSVLESSASDAHYHHVPLPHAVGGRYSVFTTVGLVPLILLGHDVRALLAGAEETIHDELERELPQSFIAGSMLASAEKRNVHVYDTFLFDTALRNYGLWRRQLVAESLGKSKALDGRTGTFGVLPTVSTLVDLHSVGQLYMGGFRGIHTDFVARASYGDTVVPSSALSSILPHIEGKNTTVLTQAIYHGVTIAYRERGLPYNEYQIKDRSLYEMGALMAFNMLETMYAAELLGVDAFDQPNVELYKQKMREALD